MAAVAYYLKVFTAILVLINPIGAVELITGGIAQLLPALSMKS